MNVSACFVLEDEVKGGKGMTVQGNNDDNDNNKDSGKLNGDNVVHLRPPASRPRDDRGIRITITQGGVTKGIGEAPPLINLPPMTKVMVLTIVMIEAIMKFILDPVQQYWVIEHFGFTPAYYSGAIYAGAPAFGWPAIVGPFTHMLIHGGWVHVLMNGAMLMAFGAGLERWMGWRRMGLFMLCCGLVSAGVHLLFYPGSDQPVVGASGAISGMFAAAMVMLKETGRYEVRGRYGFMPFIVVWIGVSVLFGVVGGPGGEQIAWAAHIGGFLAGFILIKFFRP